jgi:CMP-N-acetylneuraminic acid synthetase
MKEERKVAVVLQGRLNSQRVPNKMIRDFGDTNLFTLALGKLEASWIPRGHIYISVGDQPLLEIAKKYPFNIYHRTPESCNATNNPNVPDSLKLLYEWYRYLIGEGYTHVMLLSACHPLLQVSTINSFYSRCSVREDLDGLFSVVKRSNYYWDEFGEPITDWDGAKLMNTRRVRPIYEAAHCLYFSKISYIQGRMLDGLYKST